MVVHMIMYAAFGAFLASLGFPLTTWQFWVAFALFTANEMLARARVTA